MVEADAYTKHWLVRDSIKFLGVVCMLVLGQSFKNMTNPLDKDFRFWFRVYCQAIVDVCRQHNKIIKYEQIMESSKSLNTASKRKTLSMNQCFVCQRFV